MGPDPVPKVPTVETKEMVHVNVGDEDVGDAQDLARGQALEITAVEQERAPIEKEIDVDAGVLEGAVDQFGRGARNKSARDAFM